MEAAETKVEDLDILGIVGSLSEDKINNTSGKRKSNPSKNDPAQNPLPKNYRSNSKSVAKIVTSHPG